MIKVIYSNVLDNLEGRAPVRFTPANLKEDIISKHFNSNDALKGFKELPYPGCVYAGGVLNVITKKASNDRMTFGDLRTVFESLYKVCAREDIKAVVLTKIWKGENWNRVLEIMGSTIGGLDVLVCSCEKATSEQVQSLMKFGQIVAIAIDDLKAKQEKKEKDVSVDILGQKIKSNERLWEILMKINRWVNGNFLNEEDYGNMCKSCVLVEKKTA